MATIRFNSDELYSLNELLNFLAYDEGYQKDFFKRYADELATLGDPEDLGVDENTQPEDVYERITFSDLSGELYYHKFFIFCQVMHVLKSKNAVYDK